MDTENELKRLKTNKRDPYPHQKMVGDKWSNVWRSLDFLVIFRCHIGVILLMLDGEWCGLGWWTRLASAFMERGGNEWDQRWLSILHCKNMLLMGKKERMNKMALKMREIRCRELSVWGKKRNINGDFWVRDLGLALGFPIKILNTNFFKKNIKPTHMEIRLLHNP